MEKKATTLTVFKALSDESRIRILRLLIEKPQYVESLAAQLDLAVSTVSFHLKKLVHAELVDSLRDQYYRTFYINKTQLQCSIMDLISDFAQPGGEEMLRMQAYRKKVIDTFFCDGKLTKVPAQKKKKKIVLAFFLNDFSLHQDYLEQEVNEIIMKRFDDYCRIRRDLVDEGWMQRNNGIYTKVHEGIFNMKPEPLKNEYNKMDKNIEKTTRRQAARILKESTPTAGIYWIRNKETDRVLLCSSSNLHGPLERHRFELKLGSHRCKQLQKDWNRLGDADLFEFKIVEKLVSQKDEQRNPSDLLEELEQKWIEKMQPFADNCYNTNNKIRS